MSTGSFYHWSVARICLLKFARVGSRFDCAEAQESLTEYSVNSISLKLLVVQCRRSLPGTNTVAGAGDTAGKLIVYAGTGDQHEATVFLCHYAIAGSEFSAQLAA